MYRKTYVEIDCEALENNIKEIKNKYNNYKYYIGVVKNNAYGHGIECVKYMIKGGINYLAVSSLEEALKLRELISDIPILILEPIHYDGIKEAIKNNLTITIDNVDYFNKLLNDNIKIKFHLKVDSGMNRFGLKDKFDIKYIVDNSNNNLFLEGIYTQLSKGIGSEFLREKTIFEDLTSLIDLSKIPIVHIERSLTLEQHDKLPYDNGIRLGLIMYGFNKRKYTPSWKRKLYNKLTLQKDTFVPSILNLKTVFKFYTEVLEIKSVNAGEIVGYGDLYDTKKNIKVAILPYGFADFLYLNTNYVSINNKNYNIIANYMDVTSIVIDDTVKVGDTVEIFGNNISIRTASELAGQNVYKLLTSVTYRVPRIYKYKDKTKEVEY